MSNDDPCPQCGGADSTRWLESTEDGDTWGCHDCGHEWTVPVFTRANIA
jgi:predicted RNA-binding Zn-ribbon protein involved in translation (DUF1610 family)